MTGRVQALFSDVLLDDPEGTRIEIALYVASIIAAVLLVLSTAANEPIETVIAACAFGVGAGCACGLSRRGHRILPRVFITAVALLATTSVAWRHSGIHDLSLQFYPVIVIFAGLLLGKWATVFLAALCSACGFLLVYGSTQGSVASEFAAVTEYGDAATLSIMLALSAGVLWFVMDSLHRVLRTLRASELELAKSNQQLESQADELRASEARWRSLVRSAPDRIMNVSRHGEIAFVNHPTAGGASAAPGTSVYELVPASEHETLKSALDRVFDGAEAVSCEVRGLGEDRWYSIRLGPIEQEGAVAASTLILTDITDRKRGEIARWQLERQLHEAQKLEALGQLSGGIAHDFNNLLTVIAGNTSLLETHLREEWASEILDDIQKAEERAASLTRQLLAFGRRQVLQPRVFDLNVSIASIRPMLQRLIGEHIEFEFAPSNGTAPVKADPGQLEQVLVNLVLNARDAMQEGGRLEVRTWRHQSNTQICVDGTSIDPGCYTVLSVTDDGTGMDRETRVRMFEPFFTTKPQGKGSGLGLSCVLGIVRQSGGQVAVESAPRRGTEIRVYLPEADEPIESRGEEASPNVEERGSGRILVVDDDKAVRRLLERLLTARGYTVHVAEDGRRALEIAREHEGQIDLLLTDLVMPGMNGKTLADRFDEVHGPASVLYMSGYADDTQGIHRILENPQSFIQKPFNSRGLFQKLGEILDR